MTTPAGWYPDPSGAGGQRYFDGANWTDHRTIARVKRRRVWPWVTAGVLLLFFGGCAATLVHRYFAPTNYQPGLAEKGDTVTDENFRFVVTDFGKTTLQDDPPPKGEWDVVVVTVTNTSNEPQSFLVQNQKLIDKAGREYPAADMAADSLHQQTTILNMTPGQTLTVRMRFDVPLSAKLTSVKLHGSASSAGATVSLW